MSTAFEQPCKDVRKSRARNGKTGREENYYETLERKRVIKRATKKKKPNVRRWTKIDRWVIAGFYKRTRVYSDRETELV